MKSKTLILTTMIILVAFNSCKIQSRSMKTPNYHIEFYKGDFEYSGQVIAEATTVRVMGVDWRRLMKWHAGSIESDRFNIQDQSLNINGTIIGESVYAAVSAIIPVIGNVGKGRTSNYALFKLMQENPGYDVVIYPQYYNKSFIIPLFYSKRNVQVTARLARIRE
jgi:hypothetical protein